MQQKIIRVQIFMPRTELLGKVTPNRIYAIEAQVLYLHESEGMLTAVIGQEDSQAKIKIPKILGSEGVRMREGQAYHFGYCYIGKNGWISARHPNSSIKLIEDNDRQAVKPILLSDAANQSNTLGEKYITTPLYVIGIKNEQDPTLCTLNCFAYGYLVDVNIWNNSLEMDEIVGKWAVFSGFRIKKLTDWNFVLTSSVYSKITDCEVIPKSLPYSQFNTYHNLSSVYEKRTLSEIVKLSTEADKLYSQTEAVLQNLQMLTYEGCSICHKKIEKICPCSPLSSLRIYQVMKLKLVENRSKQVLFATVFNESIEKSLLTLTEPTLLKFSIKTIRKVLSPQNTLISHIVTQVKE